MFAVDGTKLHANVSRDQNLDYDQIARDVLPEADAVDRAEGERFGERRGGELPPELATAQGVRQHRLDRHQGEGPRPGRWRAAARPPDGSAAAKPDRRCGRPAALVRELRVLVVLEPVAAIAPGVACRSGARVGAQNSQ